GGAAVEATGTPEQKERFLKRFKEGEPKWAAMAMTESHAGSDTAAIRTSARLSEDGKEWRINGAQSIVPGGAMPDKQTPRRVVARPTLEVTAGYRKERGVLVRYGIPLRQQTAIERDLLQMEAQHRAALLLVLRAAARMDTGEENTLEASMCKVKAGAVANLV